MYSFDPYGMFRPDVVEARENDAMAEFDRAYPNAIDAIWSAGLGLGSLTGELAEKLGSREYDSEKRRLLVLVDGLESIWLAAELLFRGRLNGAATVLRRGFELSLEAQAWAQRPKAMEARFANPERAQSTPAATRLIRWLHGDKDAVLQRRTYSTLCSSAHGGEQASEYLVVGTPPALRIQPAPAFVQRHQTWLLGTLVSAEDALLGAGIVIGDQIGGDIGRNHAGHGSAFREWLGDIPDISISFGMKRRNQNGSHGPIPTHNPSVV